MVTHGEPHPGNVLLTPGGPLLIDWDTVRIAPPERDLWLLTSDPFAPVPDTSDKTLQRYAEATAHPISAPALSFYRQTWILDDLAAYLDNLRRPHTPGPDADAALTYLTENLATISFTSTSQTQANGDPVSRNDITSSRSSPHDTEITTRPPRHPTSPQRSPFPPLPPQS